MLVVVLAVVVMLLLAYTGDRSSNQRSKIFIGLSVSFIFCRFVFFSLYSLPNSTRTLRFPSVCCLWSGFGSCFLSLILSASPPLASGFACFCVVLRVKTASLEKQRTLCEEENQARLLRRA